ncbi:MULTISPECIES: helix-turn-helix transcriptional regulator [Serratia]|uniref:helix-turn-helix transcriptional regulator n=1 Tax=Serratia TaxID=613 RepID=UPI00090060B4|nr:MULTISPECIES: AlpA family phage regulatory protein [Serratia]UTN95856.1 AlpA family transcriptional regulator [Serratia plymuthica]
MSWSTINALEKAGEFPKRLALTESRVAWNSDEIVILLDARQETSTGKQPVNMLDVRQRKTHSVPK